MDALLAAAISEICSVGPTGITLKSLWATLQQQQQQPLSESIKSSLWTQLLSVPSLQLETATSPTKALLPSSEPKIKSYEHAEKIDLKIVANQHIRDCFSGLYDVASSSLSALQRLALQRVASSRTNGITQNQLAKEMGKEGNYAFYVVKSLESKQLIVRQPVIVKTKEITGDGETWNSSSISTNLIYLPRYVKHLGSQQRFEISKEEQTFRSGGDADETDIGGNGCAGDSAKEDVHIRDFSPAMKAICAKLEEADDKVLVVSDIKKDLGYSEPSGHRAWRNVFNRLKDAGFVEEFYAKVNEKVVRCLRLLKKFSLVTSGAKDLQCSNHHDNEQLMKFGRRCKKTDQLVELPIDHQIYDMIDTEGNEGALVLEVCEKLGIDRKKNDSRIRNVCTRFGMHVQAENHKKTAAYRVWTPRNYNAESSSPYFGQPKIATAENKSNSNLDNLDIPDKVTETFLEHDTASMVDVTAREMGNNMEVDGDNSYGLTKDGNCNQKVPDPVHMAEALEEPRRTTSNVERDVAIVSQSDTISPNRSTSPDSALCETSPCPPLTVDGALREHRILERLQTEKFILRPELHKWLMSLEKNKDTKMDRRTVDRILMRLQQEGLCKIVDATVPVVTNCSRSRMVKVVLHPSVKDFPPELLGEIHDRFRCFEKQNRGQGSPRPKNSESVPVLSGMMRTQIRVTSDDVAIKTEVMRANGFVSAKIVRAKLLHEFLWAYLSSLPGWDNCLSSVSNARTYKLFALEEALKAIPVELFLQVVGSAQKFDDVTEKCKMGLCLSDLSTEEYKRLRDTQATGRLSLVIDILRRLKLIRIICNGHSKDGSRIAHETFTHALELKPYIEEPLSTIAVSNLRVIDLRPRIRHDFTLSNREAVDEYWKTLEHCYGTADRRAALHAFPGSAVPEVLRFYYFKHRQRLKRFRNAVNSNENQSPNNNLAPSSKKRKKSIKQSPGVEVDKVDEPLCDPGRNKPPETDVQFMEDDDLSSSGEDDRHQEDDNMETVEGKDLRPNEGERCYSLISQRAFSKLNPPRKTRFLWTDEADRQLVMQYARRRAVLGAKIPRVDWTRLSDLPAPPETCRRKMALLNGDLTFKNALLKLCAVLSKRYARHLEKIQNIALQGEVLSREFSNGFGHAIEDESEAEKWDDFEDKTIKTAFEDVIRYKQMAKLEKCKRVGSAPEEWSGLDRNVEGHDPLEAELLRSETANENSNVQGNHQNSMHRSGPHQKLIQRLNEWKNISMQVQESLAVSNAVELLKLVFLTISTSPELQNIIADTLRRYSECDLFAAFSYLKEKKIMIGGDGRPFVLSHPFLESVSKSPFPAETGKRAAEFLGWLHERERNLMEEGIALNLDLQCGDIFQLFALVSSGELSISPSLPEEGVGEAEDFRSLKRKPDDDDDDESPDSDKVKRMKSLADSELFTRREKGFPGVKVSIHRRTTSTVGIIELCKDGETSINNTDGNSKLHPVLGQKISCSSSDLDHMQEIPDFGCIDPAARWSSESPWEAMAHYSEYLLSKCSFLENVSLLEAKVFETVYAGIQKAGDQGLTMEEVSSVVGSPGENVCEHVIDVLQAFGRALKVNAYNIVRIVDGLYHSKYFLTSSSGLSKDSRPRQMTKLAESSDVVCPISEAKDQNPVGDSSQNDGAMSESNVHKVTILNLPEVRSADTNEVQQQEEPTFSAHSSERETNKLPFGKPHVPILPWVNIDGTINKAIYRGLVRRVLGMVMHNPGILEDDISHRIKVLNPQSCRCLLDLMILDKHLSVKEMHQSTSCGPPALLRSLMGNSFRESKSVYRRHFFANLMSASLL